MATVEPWLRGTFTDIDPIRRAVLHALEMTIEDAERWASPLSDVQILARPSGLPSVAFHLRHIARSLDRLLTYAEGQPLSEEQLRQLALELDEQGTAADVLQEFHHGVMQAMDRVRAFAPETFAEPRGVGRQQLPTTVIGLLIHTAEHTQRHSGQMVTTAKLVLRDQRMFSHV